MNDLNFPHSGNPIELSEIFVYPLLSSIDIDDGKKVKRITADTIIDQGKTVYMIYGKAQHGKSAYAKQLCLELIDKGKKPSMSVTKAVISL